MTTPGEALAASTAAGTAAGSTAADTTTVACDLVRVGMFFDGTGNSRAHVGTNHIDSWHSNVDLLERRYKDSSAPETARVNGATVRAKYGKAYVRGVGIEAGGGNQQGWLQLPYGIGYGTGPEGVAARTRQGLDAARQVIRTKARGLEPCFVWLDAFGFSRGACVARDFANDIKDGAISVGGHTAQVQFMGLWDTVSSIGNPGNTGNWADEGVRINTNGTARQIVHITAKDELRENFPLTLARSGERIQLVGVHSDIGGGYFPGEARGSVSYSAGRQDAFFATVARLWNLQLGTWETHPYITSRSSPLVEGDQLSEMQVSDGMSHSHTMSFRWRAQHGMQFVSLKIMHDRARYWGVPLRDLGNDIDAFLSEFRTTFCLTIRPSPDNRV